MSVPGRSSSVRAEPAAPALRLRSTQHGSAPRPRLGLQGLRAHREPIVRLSDEACVGYELLVRGPSGGAREGAEDVFRLAVGASDLAALDLDCLQVALGSLPGMPWDGPALPEIHVNLFPSTLASVPVERVLESFPRDRALRGFCLEI